MNQTIYPIKYIEPIGRGKSRPQILLFSDGSKYVVKFKNNPHGKRSVVNEYVAGRLAQLLSLPVVPFKIIEISDKFIKQNRELLGNEFQAGNQFASLYIENCSGIKRVHKREIQNRHHLAGIIVFDQWVGNSDRARNNVLLQPLDQGGFFVHIIDHEKCFSGIKWNEDSLKELPKEVRIKYVHKWCASLLDEKQELQTFLQKVLSLPNQSIHEVVQSIPDDWNVTDKERNALFTHIVEAKKVLPDLVARFAKQIND